MKHWQVEARSREAIGKGTGDGLKSQRTYPATLITGTDSGKPKMYRAAVSKWCVKDGCKTQPVVEYQQAKVVCGAAGGGARCNTGAKIGFRGRSTLVSCSVWVTGP